MEIEKWKQFSDAVDAHNEIAYAEHKVWEDSRLKKEDEDWERFVAESKERYERMKIVLEAPYLPYHPPMRGFSGHFYLMGVSKTEVNFWEWCAGKLKLKTHID